MKPTRMRMGLITALLAVALAGYWKFLKPPEDPLCKGVPLSEWLEKPDWNRSNPPIQPEDLRAIAPKAAPFLAYYLRCNRPQIRKGIAARTPDWLHSKLPPSWVEPKKVGSMEKCFHATLALEWLGADAEPALPTLLTFLNDPDSRFNCEVAKDIHGIGPASWPTVLKIWHSGKLHAQAAIIWELPRRFQSPPAPAATEVEKKLAIDLLLEACRDPDPRIQYSASYSLGGCRKRGIGASPLFDPAIPVLIRFTEVGSDPAPEAAARALAEFPEYAGTIIPALKKMAGSPNPAYSEAAKRALEIIEKQTPKGE
jgi:hypothetical protein